jgi:hypothetical protein
MRRSLLHFFLAIVLLAGQMGVQLYALDRAFHTVAETGDLDLGPDHDQSLAHIAGLCHLFQALDCALLSHPAPLVDGSSPALHLPWYLGEPRPFAPYSNSPRAPPSAFS